MCLVGAGALNIYIGGGPLEGVCGISFPGKWQKFTTCKVMSFEAIITVQITFELIFIDKNAGNDFLVEFIHLWGRVVCLNGTKPFLGVTHKFS